MRPILGVNLFLTLVKILSNLGKWWAFDRNYILAFIFIPVPSLPMQVCKCAFKNIVLGIFSLGFYECKLIKLLGCPCWTWEQNLLEAEVIAANFFFVDEEQEEKESLPCCNNSGSNRSLEGWLLFICLCFFCFWFSPHPECLITLLLMIFLFSHEKRTACHPVSTAEMKMYVYKPPSAHTLHGIIYKL